MSSWKVWREMKRERGGEEREKDDDDDNEIMFSRTDERRTLGETERKVGDFCNLRYPLVYELCFTAVDSTRFGVVI